MSDVHLRVSSPQRSRPPPALTDPLEASTLAVIEQQRLRIRSLPLAMTALAEAHRQRMRLLQLAVSYPLLTVLT